MADSERRPDVSDETRDPAARQDPDPEQEGVAGLVGRRLAEAARRSGAGAFTPSTEPDSRALLAAMGGVRGIIEAVAPALMFVVVFAILRDVWLALAVSVGVAVVLTLARLVMRSPLTQAFSGLIGVLASAGLALLTRDASDFFLLGLLTNAGYALALLVSIVVGWPVIGLVAGYLMGEGVEWRRDAFKLRTMRWLTVCWLGLFVARLVVEVPLYLADAVGGLALAKLLMGIPLYAPLLLVSWLVVRSAYGLAPARSRRG